MALSTENFGALEARLVDFAMNFSLDDAGPASIEAAQMLLLDTIGVGMAAYLAPPARIARRMAQPTAGALKATVWGTGTQASPEAVAFANGVMVRYLDLNDAYRTMDAHHPSDYTPGILAVAEATGASGRAFFEAMIVAYEIMCRFTDSVPFNDRGFDQPLTGAMATALAAGRLLGLDREGMRDALALAIIPNMPTYQTRAGELSMWKGCAGPNGARNGVFAAWLASQGMTGPFQAFDGVFGIWNQATGGDKFDITLPEKGHTKSWGIRQSNIKTYPVRDSCQLPIITALKLREKLNGRPVDTLKIETYRSAHTGAVKDPELWAPKTRETADHSMLFSTACAIIDGRISADSFENARFLDADVLALIGRTEVEVLDEFTKATPQIRNCRIIATSGGETIEAHHVVTLAEIEEGMPRAHVLAKFRNSTSRCYAAARQDAIIAAIDALPEAATTDQLIRLLEL
jgi:2-methylcitrate dehydratase